MFDRFLKSAAAKTAARTIMERVRAEARAAELYEPGGAPDSLQGRFEMLTLFSAAALSWARERGDGRLGQHLVDMTFGDIDYGLRETGVGDMSITRKIKPFIQSFYGRLEAYGPCLTEGDESALGAALLRNVSGMDEAGAALAARRAQGFFASLG